MSAQMTASCAVAPLNLPAASGLAERIVALLRVARLSVNTEDEQQREIAQVLAANNIAHAREVRVSGGRIDVLAGEIARFPTFASVGIEPGVGIEAKIKGGKRAIHRQCAAYCNDPRIGHLIVITGVALALPEIMNRKPVKAVHIGKAWL